MMCYCLIIKRGPALYLKDYNEKIHHEEAATCNHSPNMNVSDCVNAHIAVKDGLITWAYHQEADRTQNDADARVENRDDRCAEIGLLLLVTIRVNSSSEAKKVHDEVCGEEKGDCKYRELEIVLHVFIGRLHRGVVPPPIRLMGGRRRRSSISTRLTCRI